MFYITFLEDAHRFLILPTSPIEKADQANLFGKGRQRLD